jgi:hypothetical protein
LVKYVGPVRQAVLDGAELIFTGEDLGIRSTRRAMTIPRPSAGSSAGCEN